MLQLDRLLVESALPSGLRSSSGMVSDLLLASTIGGRLVYTQLDFGISNVGSGVWRSDGARNGGALR